MRIVGLLIVFLLLLLPSCGPGRNAKVTPSVAPTSFAPAATATPGPATASSSRPQIAPTPLLPTLPPAVSGWIADYRPSWIGFIYNSGTLVAVTPDQLGSTKAETKQGYVSTSQHKPGDQVVVSEPDKTGRIITWVFKPSTQNEFNVMLAEWQQTLKTAYLAGPCTIGVKGYDATVTFSGQKAHDWCAALERSSAYQFKRIAVEPSTNHKVCEVDLDGAQARARDTGEWAAGDLCNQLENMVGSPPPANWDTAQKAIVALMNAINKIEDDVGQLKWASDFKSLLDSYAQVLSTMQRVFGNMQELAAKRPFYCSLLDGIKDDLKSLGDMLDNSMKENDNVLLKRSTKVNNDIEQVNQDIRVLQQARAGVSSTIASSDIEAAIATSRKQLEEATNAVQVAKVQAVDYAQKAIALYKSGQDLVAGLPTCVHWP